MPLNMAQANKERTREQSFSEWMIDDSAADDLGSLAGGILEIMHQNQQRTKERSLSMSILEGDSCARSSFTFTASLDVSGPYAPDNGTITRDSTCAEETVPCRLASTRAGGKPPIHQSQSDPNLILPCTPPPNFITQTSSRDLFDDLSNAGSIVQTIMDDIGKAKTNIEVAEALLAIAPSYEEVRDALSLQDVQPFEDDSLSSNFTSEGFSISSRLSIRSASKRTGRTRGNSFSSMPKRKGPGLPVHSYSSPPFLLRIPKPPQKGGTCTKDQETSKDFEVDERDNDASNKSTPPTMLRVQSNIPLQAFMEQTFTLTPPGLQRCMSHDPTTMRTPQDLLYTPTLTHIPQRGVSPDTMSESLASHDKSDLLQQSPYPESKTLLQLNHMPISVNLQSAPSEEILSHYLIRISDRGVQSDLQPNDKRQTVVSVNASHERLKEKMSHAGSDITATVFCRSRNVRDDQSHQKSIRSSKSGGSGSMLLKALQDRKYQGEKSGTLVPQVITKGIEEPLFFMGKIEIELAAIGERSHQTPSRSENQHSKQKIRERISLAEKFNVLEMKLPHEMSRRNSRHDQYLQHARHGHQRSHQTTDTQVYDHSGNAPPSRGMEPDASDRRGREQLRATMILAQMRSGKQPKPTIAKHENGVPMIIQFDIAKSGRAISPYVEKDDRELDLNAMAAKVANFGHTPIRQAKQITHGRYSEQHISEGGAPRRYSEQKVATSDGVKHTREGGAPRRYSEHKVATSDGVRHIKDGDAP